MTHEEQVDILTRSLGNAKAAIAFAEAALDRYRIDETDDLSRDELLGAMRQLECVGSNGIRAVEAYSWDDEKDD